MIPAERTAPRRRSGRRADPRPVDGRRRSAAREHSRVRPPHGADRHREIRPGERGPRSGREDPRRGPRLLRHVRHRHRTRRSRTRATFARPYVVSWNLTYRCNLACEHCYLDAGGTPLVGTENFADRSELGTEECFRVIDEIAAFAPECLTILTGGEPLLRRDILEIVRRAAERGLWVVVGTNGVRITENLARRLAEAGARGLSLSLDALDPDRHDRFRKVRGAWRNTVEGAEILEQDRAPLHRADDRGLAQSRRARRDRRLRARSPRRQGLEPLLPGADGARAVRVGHHPRAVRRGARLALPDPEEVRPPDAREREVRSALHQDRSGECRRAGRSDPDGCRIGEARPRGPVCPRSGPTPEGPAGARRGRTTWGYGRTGMSPLAPTSRSSRGRFAARVSRTSGRPRSCSPTFAAAPRSAGDAGSAR